MIASRQLTKIMRGWLVRPVTSECSWVAVEWLPKNETLNPLTVTVDASDYAVMYSVKVR